MRDFSFLTKPALLGAVTLMGVVGLWAEQGVASEGSPWKVALFADAVGYRAAGVDADGTQGVSTVQLAYHPDERWGVGFSGSYAATDYRAAGSDTRYSLTGLNDGALVTYYQGRLGGGRYRVGIDVGVPIGTSDLSNEQLGAIMIDDLREDLTPFASYGAGLNVAPHGELTWRIGGTTLGLGARYLVAGAYDPAGEVDSGQYDPGDALTLVGSVLTIPQEGDNLMATLQYTTYQRDTLGGREIFRNGSFLAFDVRYLHGWTSSWLSAFVAKIKTQEKNELKAGEVMSQETGNANGNVYEVAFENVWKLPHGWSVTGVAAFASVAANEYADGDPLYDGGRTRWFVEPGMVWRFSGDAYITGKLRYTRIDDKQDAQSPADATYDHLLIDFGWVRSF